eukprot:gene16087-biopygen1190
MRALPASQRRPARFRRARSRKRCSLGRHDVHGFPRLAAWGPLGNPYIPRLAAWGPLGNPYIPRLAACGTLVNPCIPRLAAWGSLGNPYIPPGIHGNVDEDHLYVMEFHRNAVEVHGGLWKSDDIP